MFRLIFLAAIGIFVIFTAFLVASVRFQWASLATTTGFRIVSQRLIYMPNGISHRHNHDNTYHPRLPHISHLTSPISLLTSYLSPLTSHL